MRADVAVVGLGAMGAAVLYQLARRGVQAVGIDRFAPPHAMGSSHGETRLTRRAVGEGDSYVPLVTRSHAIWRELEAETGEQLMQACGLLMLARPGLRTEHHGRGDFLNQTAAVARRHGIDHEVLDTGAIQARFPNFALEGDEVGYFEPGAGVVRPERCIAAQLRRAGELGATILNDRAARAINRHGSEIGIETDDGTILAGQVVAATGAWSAKLLGRPFDTQLVPYRQVLHWFPVADEGPWRAEACPAYLWMHGTRPQDYFYGFPSLPGACEVKVATEQYGEACDPDTVDRTVTPAEATSMHTDHLVGRLRGVLPRAERSSACLYTVTADSGFVIDRHPDMERLIVVSACSGHGFKHSAGIGDAVAQLVCEGRSDIDLAPFRLDRLQAGQAA